ncbi:hypothetical protein [Ammoniphilus sp. 3BR4]|uniref:hypothetical protein n=1 Tax=Ammoniphilus sp. 3BR4 TaxID=3158265 RepID=UPI003466A976
MPIFFNVLDLRPYAKQLINASPLGADGHCRQGILRALLAAPLSTHVNDGDMTPTLMEQVAKKVKVKFFICL